MGRSFVSIRQRVKDLAERWARVARTLRPEDRPDAARLAASAKKHSSEAFFGCDDPLEAAIFSALVDASMLRGELPRSGREPDVDP
jgi:hypothetical protein